MDQVSKSVRSGDIDINIMNNVSLQVAKGEHIAITGPSGSGKTTLLNLISGIDVPTSGKVLVDGQVVSLMSEEKRVAFREQMVGMVFQDFCLFKGLTALENVKLFSPNAPVDVCKDMLSQVGLANRMSVTINHLSGGEKQRVGIARAMIKSPKILLADEPTAQLDVHTAKSVMELFFSLKQTHDVTLVLITHDLNVASLCDRSISMESLTHA